MNKLLSSAALGWLGRRALDWGGWLGTFIVSVLTFWNNLPEVQQDFLLRLLSRNWQEITLGALIPFLGLVVPNIVSLIMGDNLRRTLPVVAVSGAGLVLACDIVGRLLIAPYEIPVGTVMGVIGSLVFLHLLLSRRSHAG